VSLRNTARPFAARSKSHVVQEPDRVPPARRLGIFGRAARGESRQPSAEALRPLRHDEPGLGRPVLDRAPAAHGEPAASDCPRRGAEAPAVLAHPPGSEAARGGACAGAGISCRAAPDARPQVTRHRRASSPGAVPPQCHPRLDRSGQPLVRSRCRRIRPGGVPDRNPSWRRSAAALP
jgi:hypothetical protein